MIKVKLSTQFPASPLSRQTSESSGLWDNCQFYINQDIEECDFWVVYDDLYKPEKTICPKENTIFITGEPPSVKTYSREFLKQFNTVITCNKSLKHDNIIYFQQGLPWSVGMPRDENWNLISAKTYDEFKAMEYFEKNKLLSVITSSKNFTEGHRKRLDFIKKLKTHFGSEIDIFGIKIDSDGEITSNPCDKDDAIIGYKYHLVIENSSYPDYWTEKLSDTYLDGAYPFYYGCPNLANYFPENAFTHIDINKPQETIEIIEKTIKNNQYERSIDKINEARNLVLDKYNLFALITEHCNEKEIPKNKSKITIKPQSMIYQKPNLLRIVRSIISGFKH